MEKTEILARVDHTALKSTATWEDIRLLCEEAVEYKTASVCIPPSYLKRQRAAFPATESMYSDWISTGLQHDGEQSL